MQHHADTELPAPMDCETQSLMRMFMVPIFDAAQDWKDLASRLTARGYKLAFRSGRMVILDDMGKALSTGRGLGVPMADLTAKWGAPQV
jgi:hypothetical protein